MVSEGMVIPCARLSMWIVIGLLAVLVGCQGQIGRSVPPAAPSIGDLASVTHQSRVTLSGAKPGGSSILINGEELVARDPLGTWSAVVSLPSDGSWTFEIRALDDRGQISPALMVSIIRDTSPPVAPTIDPVTSPASANPVVLSGTKEAGALVRLNGRRIIPPSAATTWSYQATLVPGPNTAAVTVVDIAGNESDPTTVSVTLTPTCAVPRPVFPLDRGAIVWGETFTWQVPSIAPSDGYRFELSASPAFDSLIDTVDTPLTLYVPTIPSPPGGVYFWRVGALDGNCGVSYGLTRMVTIGSTTGDINGDGYADAMIGVVGDDTVDRDAGAAYIYHGGPSPEVQPDIILTGEHRLDGFGNSVAKAGDIDGDGYVDLLVGAYLFDRDADQNDNVGRAYLFWGGPNMSTQPGLVLTGEQENGYFGVSVAGVGDVNGDGYPDVAVGAYRAAVTAACGGGTARLPAVGRVDVFFGGPRLTMDAKADVVLTGETTASPGDPASACRQGDEFGGRLAGVGDANGDGYDDILVGARGFDLNTDPSDPSVGQDAGRAYLFYGGPWLVGMGADQADVVFTGTATADEFGATVAGVGDTNGDGFADLVVGAPLRDGTAPDSGSAYWYFGGSGLSSTSSPVLLEGVAAEDNFGFSVASAGDVNHDGFADIIVGAFLAGPSDNGSATLYLGGAPPAGSPAATYTGETDPQSGDQFGLSVSGAGDVNKDGYDDVIVGAYHNDACCGLVGGDAGRAYIFPGSPSPTSRGAASDPTNDWIFTGRRPGDGLGIAVR